MNEEMRALSNQKHAALSQCKKLRAEKAELRKENELLKFKVSNLERRRNDLGRAVTDKDGYICFYTEQMKLVRSLCEQSRLGNRKHIIQAIWNVVFTKEQ